MATLLDRRGLLCDQPVSWLTGIDFVQVVDPADQTELLIFFVIEPDLVVTALGPPVAPMVDPASLPLAFTGPVSVVAVGGGETAAAMTPFIAEFRQVAIGGGTRIALYLRFAVTGDFAMYRLHVGHAAIDPFFNDVLFSFKQGCGTGFDCAPQSECLDLPARDVEIDYLARDFESLNSALGDFVARYYPEWGEPLTADAGVMMTELFAALGDEFAYVQDRYAREAYLETATQRRSLMRLARLVDYVPDPGRNAACQLAIDMRDQPVASNAIVLRYSDRLPFWAVPEGRPAIPFELGRSLADADSLLAHASWNALRLHLADPGQPCLAQGATELLLAPTAQNGRLPLNSQIPAGGLSNGLAWVGRTMILQARPIDPAIPVRAWAVTITDVDMAASDALIRHSSGNPTNLTRIRWDAAQALPFAMRIEETVLLGNVAPALAGRTVRERFRIGPADPSMPVEVAALPQAVEREGPATADCAARPVVVLQGLAASEAEGVNHIGAHNLQSHRVPDILLRELASSGNPADDIDWTYVSSLLSVDEDDRAFTLDPGLWRTIIRYQRNGQIIPHADYARDLGYSLHFGSGDFGRRPGDGSVFEVTFRTAIGARSNVTAGAVRAGTSPADPSGPPTHPDIVRVFNPLPATGGTDSESAESIRQNAPDYHRAFLLNAIRARHFREIVERETWVQRAGARTRWTGSWLTHFVTADPVDAFAYTPEQRGQLSDLVDSVRMAGRDATIRDPLFVPLDMEISLCVEEGHYPGHVREAVIEALTGRGLHGARPFFDPDHFSFGDPLRRAMLEAAVQAVPGVRGVTGICLRQRGIGPWMPFTAAAFAVPMNGIVRLDNDPLHPGRGTLQIRVSQSVADDVGCACCAP